MARADWPIIGESNKIERSNVMITITDNAGVVEGREVVAVCNRKTFTSTMKNGVAKLYTTEVGTYTITVGEYNTMLVCPYFGMFSTDIYSGTLKVTCIEAGGNGKSCHVQSCDDNYEFTDSYNLTQTFDVGLELAFMGIPTGKYLITVDDRYRFFKEITSIQNVNQIEVELKQWLFNNGDQCEWNTGGWMQCQATGTSKAIWGYYGGITHGPYHITHTENLEYTSNYLRLNHNCIANEAAIREGDATGYYRSDGSSSLYIGTAKHISIPLGQYIHLTIISDHTLTCSLRKGELNNSSTNTSSSTVLVSSSNSNIDLATENVIGSLVVGETYTMVNKGYGLHPRFDGYGNAGNYYYNGGIKRKSQGNVNETYSTNISEIYLQ